MDVRLLTKRLIIRDYAENDLEGLHKLLSDKVNMYFLDDISTDTIEESRENLRNAMSNSDGHYFCITDKETGEFIGSIGYTITEESAAGKDVHMGYFISPEFQGRGYTTEAVKRVLEYAFTQDNCLKVTTACYGDNIPSRKVMEKAGFRKIAERKQVQLHDGVMKDRLEYVIGKDEFLRTDKELARLAREGDKAALDSLMQKYNPLVNAVIKGISVPGAEREDLLQEGMIGLYRAILSYDSNRAQFSFFAKLCVERRLHTVVKTALRGKHSPLSSYEPITPEMRADMETPEEILLTREELTALENVMNARLSRLERRTLAMRLTGLGNGEIAEKLKLTRKAVDNALWRARKKLGEGSL